MTTLQPGIRLALSKIRQAKKGKHQGFTLIELLIVVIILGVLSGIAIPSFVNQSQKAKDEAGDAWASAHARSCASLLLTGLEAQFTGVAGPNGGAAPTTCADATAFTGDGPGTATTYTANADGSVTQ